MRTRVALCIENSLWAIGFLDRSFQEELAKNGDGRKYQLLTECTLISRNWKGNAKVTALA